MQGRERGRAATCLGAYQLVCPVVIATVVQIVTVIVLWNPSSKYDSRHQYFLCKLRLRSHGRGPGAAKIGPLQEHVHRAS